MIRMTGLPCILLMGAITSWATPNALEAQSAGHLRATARVLPAEPAQAALALAREAAGGPRVRVVPSRLPSIVVRQIAADHRVTTAEPRPRLLLIEVNYLSN